MSESRECRLPGELLALPIEILNDATTGLAVLEAVFRDHAPKMKSIAFNLLGNEHDAEDAIQEAFLKAHRGLDAFGNRSGLHTWVYRVLINTCLDEGRRRQRLPVATVEAPVVSRESPADQRAALRQAISQLENRQRAVFLMSAVEGLPHAEIASILEITETNSRTLLLEARRNLQARLRV